VDNFDNFLLVSTTSIMGILMVIGGILNFIYAIRRRNRLIFLFSAMWLLYAVFWFMDAAAHYFYSIPIMKLAIIPHLIGVPCIIAFIELTKKEHVSPVKMSILVILEAIVFYTTFFVHPVMVFIIRGFFGFSRSYLFFIMLVCILSGVIKHGEEHQVH